MLTAIFSCLLLLLCISRSYADPSASALIQSVAYQNQSTARGHSNPSLHSFVPGTVDSSKWTKPASVLPTGQQQAWSKHNLTAYRFFNLSCGGRYESFYSNSAFPDFSRLCVLWDPSCSGTKSQALSYIPSIAFHINNNVCFGDPWCQCSVDGKPAPSASTSAFAELLKYLRTPECKGIFGKHSSFCCGGVDGCTFGPTEVELYYWPDTNANTSCLSIIGDGLNPWDYGATITSSTKYGGRGWKPVMTYWGCTTTRSVSYSPWASTYITTVAVMTSNNGFTWKSYSHNPWAPSQPCTGSSLGSRAHSDNSIHQSAIMVRARSLISADPAKRSGGLPLEVTLDGHALSVDAI